jgi:hypothetical protein
VLETVRRILVRGSPEAGDSFSSTTKTKGLGVWLKPEALSSNPSTAKKKKKFIKKEKNCPTI